MKKTLLTLALLGVSVAMVKANTVPVAIPSPGGTVEIGARIRWGASGFEASIFDNNPFAQTPTLNPGGSPVWSPVSGAPHKFQITFDSLTGTLGLDVDFNRDLVFGAGESITRNVFNNPPTTSYIGYGFKYLLISGNESGNAGRSSVGNLVINGTSLASMTPAGGLIENFYKGTSDSLFTLVTITGEMDFTVPGTSQERPSWNFNLMNSEIASVPDGGTTLVLLGSALMGLAALRRKLGA